jgi:Zn finger protein HypA/HybF involved in hydrogenase expression
MGESYCEIEFEDGTLNYYCECGFEGVITKLFSRYIKCPQCGKTVRVLGVLPLSDTEEDIDIETESIEMFQEEECYPE